MLNGCCCMLTADIENFLARGLEQMGLQLPDQPEALAKLARYFQELKKWNRKINLVARTMDDQQILENHFLDSLTLQHVLKHGNHEQESVMDIGTGAGFPGLVLKTVNPALPVVLVEPRSNRYYFLKHVARTLDLENLELLNVRVDETGDVKDLSGRTFSLITSRAFTDIGQFVRLAGPYLAPGGRIVCMKGPGAGEELGLLEHKGFEKYFKVEEKMQLQLPMSRAERMLVIVRRSGENQQ